MFLPPSILICSVTASSPGFTFPEGRGHVLFTCVSLVPSTLPANTVGYQNMVVVFFILIQKREGIAQSRCLEETAMGSNARNNAACVQGPCWHPPGVPTLLSGERRWRG